MKFNTEKNKYIVHQYISIYAKKVDSNSIFSIYNQTITAGDCTLPLRKLIAIEKQNVIKIKHIKADFIAKCQLHSNDIC